MNFSQRSREELNIDNHPESVACVEGSSVHVLFNYLLTSKTTITTTGPHAGVPPTILAPMGFKGATLKALKVLLLFTDYTTRGMLFLLKGVVHTNG